MHPNCLGDFYWLYNGGQRVVLHKFKYVLVLVFKVHLFHWTGDTYAHPFPQQQDGEGDFFGHESMTYLVTTRNRGTSSRNLLLFPETMLWNEDVPQRPFLYSVPTWERRPVGRTGRCAWSKQPWLPSETRYMSGGVNVTKPMRRISTRCIIYIFW